MNTYRKKNYRKRGYHSRPHRRGNEGYHQPIPPELEILPYARHTLTKQDVESVVEALLSGTLTMGRELERFESLLAKLTHSDHAIGVSSGTAALHTAFACMYLKEGDEVIMSTLNFCAAANMAKLVGATPILVDCDPNTLTIGVEQARAAITESTRVILANNFAGHPADMLALRQLCQEHQLILIEDACHGLGGRHRGHYVGNQADLTCFSFHPAKAIATCEGGAITTNERAKADWMRMFRHHGLQKDQRFTENQENKPAYYQELQFAGMNYRMSELHAALGRSQLTRLDRHIERRRAIAQVYYDKLKQHDCLVLPYVADWADHAFHLFTIQLAGPLADKRDEIFNALRAARLGVQLHYIPLHRMPLYRELYTSTEAFPNAETYYNRAISLPIYPDLSYKDLERIIDAITKCIEKHGALGVTVEKESTEETEDKGAMAPDDLVKMSAYSPIPGRLRLEPKGAQDEDDEEYEDDFDLEDDEDEIFDEDDDYDSDYDDDDDLDDDIDDDDDDDMDDDHDLEDDSEDDLDDDEVSGSFDSHSSDRDEDADDDRFEGVSGNAFDDEAVDLGSDDEDHSTSEEPQEPPSDSTQDAPKNKRGSATKQTRTRKPSSRSKTTGKGSSTGSRGRSPRGGGRRGSGAKKNTDGGSTSKRNTKEQKEES